MIAAVAALTTVRQGRRAWRRASRPDLEWEVALVTGGDSAPEPSGQLEATFVNAGGGSAYSVKFLIVVGDALVRGDLGIMERGRRRTVHAREPLTVAEPHVGVVFYCRSDRTAEAVSTDDKQKTYRKRPWRGKPSIEDAFADLYPNVTMAGLRRVEHTFPMLTQP